MLNRCLTVFAIVGMGALSVSWDSLQAQRPAATPSAQVDFVRDIQPILQNTCVECHGPKKVKGTLRLDSRAGFMRGGDTGALVLPGNSEKSLIVRRLLGLDGEDRMPKDGDPLPADQIALIRSWIDQGAHGLGTGGAAGVSPSATPEVQTHWAYRRPARPALPDVRRPEWVRTPIDRFVLARLEKEGLTPSPEATLEMLVRRVSLDLIGLPPSPQEVNDVVADAARDGKDAAYLRLVDRLLASPHYGERWARPWLDLARYADSQGFEKDLPRVMWKYRDWVIDALNRDMPFDRFTVEQIAGDMLPDATPDQRIASGFHRNAMTNEEGGIDPGEAQYEMLVDRVNTTATAWLGTTLGCAQCHNHKYDPFTQKDYFRMLAFFQNGDYEVRPNGDGTKYVEPAIDLPAAGQEATRKTIQADIDRLNAELRVESPALARAQIAWEREMRLEPSTAWRVLTPASLAADGGVVLQAAPDGSVLASGPNPGEVVYTVEAVTSLPRVTAVRLEALPDPSLPKGGPGRDPYGNFQMNGFEIDVAGVSQRIKAIRADDANGGASVDTFFPKVLPRDAYFPRGWRIDASREEKRLPRQIVFTLDQPLAAAAEVGGRGSEVKTKSPGLRLRIRLKHQGAVVGQPLGRFRLSVTSSSTPQRVVELPARLRPILKLAAAERTDRERRDLATFYRTIAVSLKPTRDQIAELQKKLRALGIPTALVMRERAGYERPSAFVRRRGSFMDKGEQVYAGVPATLHPLADDQMPNRLGLANWLADKANPLTARVAVNRAWESFFGRGIVETSEDFGTQGAPPSHPELLDWLATEFLDQGWRTKAIHKLIVTSATYRQSSSSPPTIVERDPANVLLARGPRFRLEAEMVRDTVLAASGLLSRKIGGPSVFPPQPDGIWDIPYSSEKWTPSEAEDRYRRGLYVFIRRSAAYPSFMTFDATSREHAIVRRVRTNTPLQALTTLNDEAYFEAARALAARVLRETVPSAGTERSLAADLSAGASAKAEASAKAAASYAFRLVATRTPESAEVDRIVASYARQLERFRKDPEAAARTIKGYAVADIPAAEQAAWTLVANALLNLDEALTKQ
jgi:mono/diheme cytochrome c family protein